MSSALKNLLLVLGLSACCGSVLAQQLVQKPDSLQSLNEAWSWALNQNTDDYWVAYRFSTELDERLIVGISSRDDDFIEWNRLRNNHWFGNWSLNTPG